MNFLDICSGIGSARLGLEKLNFKCAGYSEIDKKAEQTYKLFFNDKEKNFGDITKVDSNKLPDLDLIVAGFPCQTFSIIGQRKGFHDDRGKIIYSLIRILKERKIKYFIFENVKGLLNINKGSNFAAILKELKNAGYDLQWNVISSLQVGIPQMRERIYIAGVRKDIKNKLAWNQFNFGGKVVPKLSNFLINNDQENILTEKNGLNGFYKYLNNKYNKNQFSVDKLLLEDYLVIDTRQSDLRLYRGKVPTLRTGRHGILYVKNKSFRKLSGQEALLLQGFNNNLANIAQENVDNTSLLSQAGNAMTVNAVSEVGKVLLESIS